MSVETMRWLDRWLGVPLCFLLSVATGGFWRRAAADAVRMRRVLCIQLAEMGSLVLADPAVGVLRERGALPCFVSFARNSECLALLGHADRERTFLWRTDSALAFAIDFPRFLAWAWRMRFDAAIDFEPCSRFSALLGLLAGARLRSGFAHEGAYRGRLHNLPVPYRGDRHISENFMALADALFPGDPPARRTWEPGRRGRNAPSPVLAGDAHVGGVLARAFAAAPAPGRLILLNPNAGDLLPQRRWPAQRYVGLAQALLRRYPDRWIGIIGAAADAPAVAALVAAIASPRCASLAGAVAVGALPALFARSGLLVSNDSGPAHIATLARTPTLVLFGPETPLLYRPLGREVRALYAGLPCSPCVRAANQRRSACTDNLCMQAIGVEDVLDAATALLDAPGSPDRRVAGADS